jgi:hypothetical protein
MVVSHTIPKSDHYRTACYVAFEIADLVRQATGSVERHINSGATLRIKCGAPHLMLELGTSGSVGDGGQPPRLPGTRTHYRGPTLVGTRLVSWPLKWGAELSTEVAWPIATSWPSAPLPVDLRSCVSWPERLI